MMENNQEVYQEFVLKHIGNTPHCDARVLHSPQDNCEYCNARPEWQALRVLWGIAFTGHSGDTEDDFIGRQVPLIKCPAEQRRDLKTINQWAGNRLAGD